MEMPTLETERLTIRPYAMSDLPQVHLFDNVRQQREWLRWTVDNYAQLAYLHQPPYGDRAVVLNATNQLIGAVGYVPSWGPFHLLPTFRQEGDGPAPLNAPEFGLHYDFKPEHRGQGWATEAVRAMIAYAFGTLGLRRIVATTEHDNLRSQALMRRVGMTIETYPHPEPFWFQVVGMLENTG